MDGEGTKAPPHSLLLTPKICHTYLNMMEPYTLIPYLKKIQKILKSRDTSLEFCLHDHIFVGIKRILLYQEIAF